MYIKIHYFPSVRTLCAICCCRDSSGGPVRVVLSQRVWEGLSQRLGRESVLLCVVRHENFWRLFGELAYSAVHIDSLLSKHLHSGNAIVSTTMQRIGSSCARGCVGGAPSCARVALRNLRYTWTSAARIVIVFSVGSALILPH